MDYHGEGLNLEWALVHILIGKKENNAGQIKVDKKTVELVRKNGTELRSPFTDRMFSRYPLSYFWRGNSKKDMTENNIMR